MLFVAVDVNDDIEPDPLGGAVDIGADDNVETPPFIDCPFATTCLALVNVGFLVVVPVMVVVVVVVFVDDDATWDGVQHNVGPRSRVLSEIGDNNCCC